MAKWSAECAPAPPGALCFQRRRENDSSEMVHDRTNTIRGGRIIGIPTGVVTPGQTSAVSGCSDEDDEESSVPVPAAALAIPRFRSCRASSASFDEFTSSHRRRTVSNNSVASTGSSRSSITSFGSSNPLDEDDDLIDDLVVVAPTLPPSPYPVDPYHFYCHEFELPHPTPTDTTNRLIHEIRRLLADCDIEYSFQPYKCKFKCVKYVQYSHVEFIIRIYTSSSTTGGKARLLLEFQRRSGSLLLWDGLYSVLYHRLLPFVDTRAAACPQSGAQKKVAPRDEDDSISVKVWKTLSISNHTPTSGVEAMKIMVTSPYVDAQREGCAGLAVITEDHASACLVAKYGIVENLVRAAASDDMAMARCAIGALINISRALASFPDQKLASQTLDQIKRATRIVVDHLSHAQGSLFSLELLRECARALGSFGQICPNEVRGCDGSAQLQHHVNHRDHLLSTLCRDALRALEANV